MSMLIQNAGNGTTPPLNLPVPRASQANKVFTIVAVGVFDGADVKFEVSPDKASAANDRWCDLIETPVQTATGAYNFITNAPRIRAEISGGGPSVSISIYIL